MEKRHYNILVVDDEPEILEIIRGIICTSNTVHIAHSGNEATDILKQHPEINLVITDLHMANGNGIKVIEYIKEFMPNTMCAVVSGVLLEDKLAVDCTDLGVDYFISKPFSKNDLQHCIVDIDEE